MKKALKLLSLLMTSLLVSVINVKAAIVIKQEGDKYGAAQGTAYYNGRKVVGAFGGLDISRYYFYVDNAKKDAYCHNPGVTDYLDSDLPNGGTLTFKNIRNLSDPIQNDRKASIYDAGLMSIINNNCGSGDKCYVAKFIAINMYEHLFPMMNSNGNNNNSEIKYIKYLINSMYDDISGDLKTLANAMGSYNVIRGKFTSGASNCTGNKCDDLGAVSDAKTMVKSALKKAIAYAEDGEATTTITNGVQKRTTTTDDNNIITYTNSVVHTVTITKFMGTDGKKEGSVKLNYKCNSNCANVNTKFYIEVNGEFQPINDLSTINFVDYTDNGTGTVKIKIEFSSASDKYKNCEPIKYTLGVTYTHYSVSQSGYSTGKCTNSAKCQGFYVANASSDTTTKTSSIDNSISLCTTPGDVSSCAAKIDNVECIACKKNEHDIDIKEGYQYANDNTCDTSGAKENIKECVANNSSDAAGHTLRNSELSNDVTAIMDKYGYNGKGVFCKEDYHLHLPGSILVDTGRYFTLKSSITGTESCYTNELGSNGTVKSAIINEGKRTVDVYNQKSMYEAIGNCIGDPNCYHVDKDIKTCKTIQQIKTSNFLHKMPEDAAEKAKYMDQWEKTCKGQWLKINGMSFAKCLTENYVEAVTSLPNSYYVRRKVTKRFYQIRAKVTLNAEYTVYEGGTTCSTSTRRLDTTEEGNGLFYGDWLPCQYYNGKEDTFECGNSEECSATVEDLTAEQKSAALDQIGRTAKVTGGGSTGGGTAGKDSASSEYVVSNGYGLKAKLGTGGIYYLMQDWNKATGYNGTSASQDSAYNNSFDDTPFNEGWRMNYNFAPDMYFWYQEEYMNKARTDQMDMYDKSLSGVSSQYCSGSVSDDYSLCNGSQNNWTDHPTVDRGSVCACTSDGCSNYNYVLSNVKYVKQSQKAEAKFITPTQFYTLHPSGSIVVGNQGQSDKIENSKELTNGLPVGLGSNGTRRYVMWFENLGEYFDKDTLGRVWGANDSVVSKLLQDRTKCNVPDSALVDEDNTQGTIHDEGVYACKYSTDCPDVCKKPEESSDGKYHCKDGEVCEEEDYNRECCPTCPPSVSYICAVTTDEQGNLLYYDKSGTETDPDTYKSQCCPDGECPVTCSFCLYDNGKLNVQYRPITSEDLNPNDRDLGRNWRWEEPINTGLELKAYVTTEEIQEKGDGIYDIPDDHFTNPNSDYEYAVKITMNGRMISKIKSLNKKDEYKDGYAGNTLKCYDLKDGDKVYENVFCYSKFIDELLADDKVKDNIQFTRVRPKDNERNNTENNERYFTSWIKADSSKWQIQTQKGFAYYKEHYGMEIDYDNDTTIDYHLGPSWK